MYSYKTACLAIVLMCLGMLTGSVFAKGSAAPSDREREARERNEKAPGKITDNRDGKTREVKPLSKRDRENLDECVTLMIIGKSAGVSTETKRLKIQGHHFKCKGMNTGQRYHKRVEYKGQLSRHLRARPDDQVNYSFTLSDDGTIDKVEIRYRGLVNNITAFVKGRSRKATSVANPAKGWRGTAQLVIGRLVNRLSSSLKSAKSNRSRGRYEWGVTRAGKGQIGRTIELSVRQNRPIYCEQICLKNRKCKAWTFTGRHGSFSPKCSINDIVNPATISQQSVAGVPRRR